MWWMTCIASRQRSPLARTPVKYCPSPPGGGRLGWGAEARATPKSHTWPDPHPCPPPSRGRDSACTSSPLDYLDDVLGLRPAIAIPVWRGEFSSHLACKSRFANRGPFLNTSIPYLVVCIFSPPCHFVC